MKIEIPNINETIEATNKNYKNIIEKEIEKICAALNYNIKKSVILGRYSAVYDVREENTKVINKVINLYKEAGYTVMHDCDYIQVNWLKKK